MRNFPLKVVSPIGKLPDPDEDLINRIDNLPKDAKIKDFIKTLDEWEDIAVIKFREIEQNAKSCLLGT